jgi:hypothetical protein
LKRFAVIHAALALGLLAASPVSMAGAGGKFIVVIDACAADGKCETFRWPLDVGSMIQCERSGTFAVVGWGVQHPNYRLRSWRCAKADEIDL